MTALFTQTAPNELKMESLLLKSRTCNSFSYQWNNESNGIYTVYVLNNAKCRLYTVSGSV